MGKYFLLVCALTISIQSCSPPSEEKVRKASARSQEVGAKYIRHQYEEYTDIVEDRIKNLDKDIDRLRGVSNAGRQEAGDNLSNSIINLSSEREQLQAKLNLMKEKSQASEEMLNRHWNIYNRALDSILLDMNAFLDPIKKNEEREKKQAN
jgi:hypothetical protein